MTCGWTSTKAIPQWIASTTGCQRNRGHPETGGLKVAITSKFLTGSPFTLNDTSFDLDRNGLSNEYLPAGTYSGTGPLGVTVNTTGTRNGAHGPNRYQMDGRFSYRFRTGERKTLDVYAEVLNMTNYTSFSNPSGDRRTPATFLIFTATQSLPRSVQFGSRFAF